MNTEQEREHFSHWIATAVPFDKNVGMVEHSIKTDAAWQGWKARAASEDFCEVLRNEHHMTKALPPSAELERLAVEAGMVSLLNHGAASCVYSEGCHGVTQEHLERFAELVRERCDALHLQALEELHQLGYTVRDDLLYPPEAGLPIAANAGALASLTDEQIDALIRDISRAVENRIVDAGLPMHGDWPTFYRAKVRAALAAHTNGQGVMPNVRAKLPAAVR